MTRLVQCIIPKFDTNDEIIQVRNREDTHTESNSNKSRSKVTPSQTRTNIRNEYIIANRYGPPCQFAKSKYLRIKLAYRNWSL